MLLAVLVTLLNTLAAVSAILPVGIVTFVSILDDLYSSSFRVHLLGRHPIGRMPAFFRGGGALLVTLMRDPVFALTIPGKVQTYLASCAAAGLAARVERMAWMSGAERAAMGARGRASSQREFDPDRLLAQLEDWMREASAATSDGAAT